MRVIGLSPSTGETTTGSFCRPLARPDVLLVLAGITSCVAFVVDFLTLAPTITAEDAIAGGPVDGTRGTDGRLQKWHQR